MWKQRTGFHLNQVGFFPNAPKQFFLEDPETETVEVQTIDERLEWYTIQTVPLKKSGRKWFGDFSSVSKPADYRLKCGERLSRPFVVKPEVYDGAERMLLSYYTWQRCGSNRGWAGKCHQELCPIVGTGRKGDFRGGYHQSADLRGWAGGVGGSIYDLIRFSLLASPLWDEGDVAGEIRWGCDYFQKVISPEGFVYDCQFVPIGYGPREYYNSPAPMPEQFVVCQLLAAAAGYFREKGGDPDYARKCLDNARRIWNYMEHSSRFDKPYVPPVGNLPRGTQGERFYWQSDKGGTIWHSLRAAAALEFYKADGKQQRDLDAVLESVSEFASRQIAGDGTENPLAGYFRAWKDSSCAAFMDCSYNYLTAGPLLFADLLRTLPDHPQAASWKKTLAASVEVQKRIFLATNFDYHPMLFAAPGRPAPKGVEFGYIEGREGRVAGVLYPGGTGRTVYGAMLLLAGSELLGRQDLLPLVQAAVNVLFGGNEDEASYINGIGYNHYRMQVFGQFFPSTPFIPGAVPVNRDGEIDMPVVGVCLRLFAELTAAQGAAK